MADSTAIRVSQETWHRLNDLKDSPGKSFDDVVRELLDNSDRAKDTSEAVTDGGELNA